MHLQLTYIWLFLDILSLLCLLTYFWAISFARWCGALYQSHRCEALYQSHKCGAHHQGHLQNRQPHSNNCHELS